MNDGSSKNIDLKKSLMPYYFNLRFYLKQIITFLFNKTVRRQNKNFKTIPIFIISFNQLDNLKKLIEFLQNKNYCNLIIIDNNSTYPPLLTFFSTIENQITIFRLKENFGHRVFWKKKELFKDYTVGYYAITDPDILPVKKCPNDFLFQFKKILDRNPKVDKVGFSLRIDCIPDFNPLKEKIINWEKKYWYKSNKDGNYIAEIDTTFALYRPGKPFISYKGIRTKPPYTAHHKSWYINVNQLAEEEVFYRENCNSSHSWKINNDGNISNGNYQ